MFCPKCKALLVGKVLRGKPSGYCPNCSPQGQAWFVQKSERAYQRGGDAAKAAAQARPSVPASVQSGGSTRGKPRAKASEEPRKPRDVPLPDRLQLPEGADLFPFGGVREGQRQFLADVAEAAREGRHLLAHAPTGLGKTVSTLAPLVAYALRHQKRVFFLTSKQSQHKIAVDTLKAIRQKAGVAFTVADVIGKQDMCPRREARELFPKRFSEFCRREQVSKQCEYWETPNQGAIKLLKRDVHHVEELVVVATEQTTCPHQAAIDLAAQAHVVVCDYNYFFSDLRASVQERLKVELKDVLLVVDEAHNLPDRIRDHLKLSLNDYVLDDAIDEANDLDDPALARLLEVMRLVLAGLADVEVERDPADDSPMPRGERYVTREELVDAVNEAFSKKIAQLVAKTFDGLLEELETAVAAYEKRFKDESSGLATLHEFLYNWKIERRGIARILQTEPAPSLAYHILDPAMLAKPVFDGVHCSVVMSGTLHPMEMMRDVLGLAPERTTMREYQSPFPPQNRLVLVDSSVTTGYKDRTPQMWRDIAERLAGAALATPGNFAAFFPSYAILEHVRPGVESALRGRKEVIVEERGMDKGEKENLIGRMRRGLEDALLMGVMAGSLSEGYDYEDNLLKGVAIVGLPFAAPSLEVESLIGYYEKKFGPGKGRPYAYVHPTFHRVLQAVGRCIRGPEDRGVILLLDKRFGWGSYVASYPRDFRPRATGDPAGDVRRFWGLGE
ncbi:MAG TPA: ATP-dependent DNA helicase, partial [Candidatus Thermoplasmatota archaeon]|nr:ATP-dependent DNA helicase [Candidatus Thermoplasmatota archaeon]